MTKVDAILYSRPLTLVSSEIKDLQKLMPCHILVGGSVLSIPDIKNVLDSLSFPSMWKLFQIFKMKFWKHWRVET